VWFRGNRVHVSSLGYRVHGCESTGYLVSRVRVLSFDGTGHRVRGFSLPDYNLYDIIIMF